jgi:peroxiredoxin (alkyl hydroperoxide reductase subunit C)
MSDVEVFPPDWPTPVDDGAASHLLGTRIPHVPLPATQGTEVDLAALPGRSVVFAYPRTGSPGGQPIVPDWDLIPGARGCTAQACTFRDLSESFAILGTRVFGLSTQATEYQREAAARLHLPFPLLSDERLQLAQAMRLPLFQVAGLTLLKRLTMVIDAGVVSHIFYPVFPPGRSADDVLNWLRR